MDKKRAEIILAAVVILTLIVVLLFVFLRKDQSDVQETQETVTEVSRPEPERVSEVGSRSTDAPPSVIARTFVERFGSFSTEVDFLNIDDVKPISTAFLDSRLDSLAFDARRTSPDTYYGVSTRVITIETVAESESEATVEITTQRKESFDSPGNTSVRYQDIVVELENDGTRWLVSDFTWGDE